METKKRQLHLQLKAWGLPRGDTLRSDPFLVIFQVTKHFLTHFLIFKTIERPKRGFPLPSTDGGD